jgi:hypothetical protein
MARLSPVVALRGQEGRALCVGSRIEVIGFAATGHEGQKLHWVEFKFGDQRCSPMEE